MATRRKSTVLKPCRKRWLKTGGTYAKPTSVLMGAKPSEVALGCLILSLAYQGKVCYPVKLQYCARIPAELVSDIVQGLHRQLRIKTCTHVSQANGILKKYSLKIYQDVGRFKPPSFRELLAHNAFRGTALAKVYRKQANLEAQQSLY